MSDTVIKLDVKDKKIIYELDLNCRQSLNQIAKKVGLSKQVISYRINRLIERGVIKGFYTIMDLTKLGFITFKVYLKFKDQNPKIIDEMINYLVKNKSVIWMVTCNGDNLGLVHRLFFCLSHLVLSQYHS